jgi:hypothetical protein
MCALFVGYSFLVEGTSKLLVFLLIPVFGCFMASSFLSFGATGEFKITYLGAGPTEIRIGFIVFNTLIICFGAGWIEKLLVYILILAVIFLCVVVYRTQAYIWKIDMRGKADRQVHKSQEHKL